MKELKVIQSTTEPKQTSVLWLSPEGLKRFTSKGWENVLNSSNSSSGSGSSSGEGTAQNSTKRCVITLSSEDLMGGSNIDITNENYSQYFSIPLTEATDIIFKIESGGDISYIYPNVLMISHSQEGQVSFQGVSQQIQDSVQLSFVINFFDNGLIDGDIHITIPES